MELGFKIVKSALVWAGFGVHCKRVLVQNQMLERVVCSNTLSINWFSYCSKPNSNSYLDSLLLNMYNTAGVSSTLKIWKGHMYTLHKLCIAMCIHHVIFKREWPRTSLHVSI